MKILYDKTFITTRLNRRPNIVKFITEKAPVNFMNKPANAHGEPTETFKQLTVYQCGLVDTNVRKEYLVSWI